MDSIGTGQIKAGSEVGTYRVVRLHKGGSSIIDEVIASEFPLTIVLNDQELVTLLCSPSELRYLTAGFLLSEGLLTNKDDITSIMVDSVRGVVRVNTRYETEAIDELLFKRLITTGCGRGTAFSRAADTQVMAEVTSDSQISFPEVLKLTREFQRRSKLYLTTHGVHSAALCSGTQIIVFSEDVGRHNAIDKVFGRCLLEDIPMEGQIVVTSGRISSEILLKVAKRNVPIIISISAPTDVAVELADSMGVTLVSSVRGGRMNIFTHQRRIIRSE